MFLPVALPRRSASRAAAKMRSTHSTSTSTSSVTILDFSKGQVQQQASASVEREVPAGVVKIVVGADSEKSVTHTRVLVSTALGVLASKLPPSSWQVVVNPLWHDLTSLAGVQRQVSKFHLLILYILLILSSILDLLICSC
jgi:TATA-binding protein-associated factor